MGYGPDILNRAQRKWNRGWWFLALAALICLLPSPATGEETPSGRTILAGCERDYPPFCIVDEEGRAGGFSVELLQAALGTMGREVSFRTGYWTEVRDLLARGEIAALPLVGRTPEREEIFDFTFPYLTLHGAIVVREDNREIKNLDDLRGRQVAVMRGDNAEEFLRRTDRGIEIRTTATFVEAFRELAAGKHDAVFIPRLVALRLLQKMGLAGLKIVSRPVEEFRQDFCFAVREGDKKTLALLNEGLALVIADGAFRRLHARWFAALELPADRKILIGGDGNYPPYEYHDPEGRPAGLVVELTRAIAREVGLEVELRLGPWDQVRRDLKEGRIDVVQGMLYSPERERDFDFTPPFLVNHYVAVVRSGEGPPPETIAELTGRRIAVERGDLMDDFLVEREVPAEIFREESQEAALAKLAAGEFDCVLAARLSFFHLTKQHGWKNLKAGKTPLHSAEYCYAFPKNRKALLARFSEGLRAVEESGEYRRIRDRWLGVYEEQALGFGRILRYSAAVILPLLLILALVLAWSWFLRREVARRTAELAASEHRYRHLFEQAPIGVFSSSYTGEILSLNSALAGILGDPGPREALARIKNLARDVYLRPEQREDLLRQLEKRGWVNNFELEARRNDGRVIWLNLNARVGQRRPDGQFVVEGFISEITERKRAELERERLIAAIEQAGEVIMITDPAGVIQYVNPAFETVTGFSRQDALGRNPQFLKSGVQDPEFYRQLGETILSGQTWRGRIVNRRPDGALYTVEAVISPVRDPEGIIVNFVAALGDISRELKLEEQYRQAHKMEAVGQLAGGVAHDFNNILQAILGYSQLLQAEFPVGEKQRDYIDEIIKGGERAATLTRQLLAFSRRQVIRLEPLDLNAVIEQLLQMLRRMIGEDIRLEFFPGNHLGTIRGDANLLEQALLDISVNARDAMPSGGVLTLETRNVLIDSEYLAIHGDLAPGRYALLSVTDSGHGIAVETLEHIFEPFFTTKPDGQGTGLGLAMVFGIIAQHNGIIRAYSEPGKGTTFKIYLPICEEKAAAVGNLISGPLVGGGERILLAEDDRMVRNLAARILEGAGYTVLTAEDGAEAVEVFRRERERVDLLVLDVVMPHQSGYEAWETIRKIRPDVPALFCSGYSANAVHTGFVIKQGLKLIQKPYPPEVLLRAVRETLDRG